MVKFAPLYSHRRNGAECDIRTFKNHFVTVLASVDNNLPIYLWCQIVKQAEINIYLIIKFVTNPSFLEYAQIFETFDFDATPMAPPGTKIMAHLKPCQRATWKKLGVGR